MPASRRQSTRIATQASLSFTQGNLAAGRRRSSVFSPATSRRGSAVEGLQSIPASSSNVSFANFAPLPDAPTPSTAPKSKRTVSAAKKKGENYIPRSPNCFLMFRNWMISEGKIPTGMMNNTTISKVVSAAWKLCSDEEKSYWRGLAAQAKFEHSLKYPDYRYQPKHTPRSAKGKAKAAAEAEKLAQAAAKQADGSVVMNPAPRFQRPSKKTRGKLTNPHQDARNEAQANFIQGLLRHGLSHQELESRVETFLSEWDIKNPAESFPEFYDHVQAKTVSPVNLPYPLQETGEVPISMPPASQFDIALPSAGHLLAASVSPQSLSPSPELAAPKPTYSQPGWVGGHRRSMSQPPDFGALAYPTVQPFFHQTMEEPIPSTQERVWLGHRRSSSVGALQYHDLPSSGRRPSTAQVLYPNAWHGPQDFLPGPTSSYSNMPMIPQEDFLRPTFQDPFSMSAEQKPILPPLSVGSFAPHDVDSNLEASLRRLSLFNKTHVMAPPSGPFSAGPTSSVAPSTFSPSQRSSPDSFADSAALPPLGYGLEAQLPAFDPAFANMDSTYPAYKTEAFNGPSQTWHSAPTAPSPAVEFDHDMDNYIQFPLHENDENSLGIASQ